MRASSCREPSVSQDEAEAVEGRPRLVMRWVRTAPFGSGEKPVRVVARWLREADGPTAEGPALV